MIALNISSRSVVSEVLGAMRASTQGTNPSPMRVFAKKVYHLFNYGMNACDDQTLVKNCLDELFLRIVNRRELLHDGGSVETNIFKTFRQLLILRIASVKGGRTCDIHENLFSPRTAMIHGVTSLQREALFLKFRSGLSYREVAFVMDETIDQLQSQISLAVDVLLQKNDHKRGQSIKSGV
jgi:DNA-directed RNA polymerase specialized sigma24 family protein